MVAQLTTGERQLAIIILAVMAFMGLALGAAGQKDLLGMHGMLISLLSVAAIFLVISGYHSPEPGEARLAEYYDDPSKVGILVAMAWAVFALFVITVAAAEVGVGLAIVLAIYRNRHSVDLDQVDTMKG